MTIYSKNEWDPLRRVVVGDASYANWPMHDSVYAKQARNSLWTETPAPSGPVEQFIIDESNEDLQTLADTLTQLGVEVVRPDPMNFQIHQGLYNYCPRDRFIVYGDKIVDPAMLYPCRDMEYQCYYNVLDDAGEIIHMPRNAGMILDAANVLRINDKMLFLESASGNRVAYDWLCEQFPDVEIELCNFYAGAHIDSTITILREGLVLLNASRVNVDNVPAVFNGWDKIWIDEVVSQDFYQYPYASKWIALNMLVVDPHTVIVDRAQTELIHKLEHEYQFQVIPLELRHSRTLGGGFHCVTLDLHREHT
jgi:glycine amidinotransferase/scyllo-inosamine-4-phosphate amidinotransferase 1